VELPKSAYREQLEGPVSRPDSANFTNRICPGCIDELDPGPAQRIERRKAMGWSMGRLF
jgi:hypothetical protein